MSDPGSPRGQEIPTGVTVFGIFTPPNSAPVSPLSEACSELLPASPVSADEYQVEVLYAQARLPQSQRGVTVCQPEDDAESAASSAETALEFRYEEAADIEELISTAWEEAWGRRVGISDLWGGEDRKALDSDFAVRVWEWEAPWTPAEGFYRLLCFLVFARVLLGGAPTTTGQHLLALCLNGVTLAPRFFNRQCVPPLVLLAAVMHLPAIVAAAWVAYSVLDAASGLGLFALVLWLATTGFIRYSPRFFRQPPVKQAEQFRRLVRASFILATCRCGGIARSGGDPRGQRLIRKQGRRRAGHRFRGKVGHRTRRRRVYQ